MRGDLGTRRRFDMGDSRDPVDNDEFPHHRSTRALPAGIAGRRAGGGSPFGLHQGGAGYEPGLIGRQQIDQAFGAGIRADSASGTAIRVDACAAIVDVDRI
jgi:hypothetical protein